MEGQAGQIHNVDSPAKINAPNPCTEYATIFRNSTDGKYYCKLADGTVEPIDGASSVTVMGDIDASTNPNYPSALAGDAYRVTVAGKIGGASGIDVRVGDVIVAWADNAGGTQAAVGADWTILAAEPGLMKIVGSIDASTNPNYPAGQVGEAYNITVDGKVGGVAGKSVKAGDLIYVITNNAGGNEAAVGADWNVAVGINSLDAGWNTSGNTLGAAGTFGTLDNFDVALIANNTLIATLKAGLTPQMLFAQDINLDTHKLLVGPTSYIQKSGFSNGLAINAIAGGGSAVWIFGVNKGELRVNGDFDGGEYELIFSNSDTCYKRESNAAASKYWNSGMFAGDYKIRGILNADAIPTDILFIQQATGGGATAGFMGINTVVPTAQLHVEGDLKTAQPSASGPGAWKLGKFLAGAVAPDGANYIEVMVDGVAYKLIVAA